MGKGIVFHKKYFLRGQSRDFPCRVQQDFMRQPGKGNRPKSSDDPIAPVQCDAEPLRRGFCNRPGNYLIPDKSPALDMMGNFS
jgi:hypothetical protein